jgi:hypothetical protein
MDRAALRLVSGGAAEDMMGCLSGPRKGVINEERGGRGRVIAFAEDVGFRGSGAARTGSW